MLEGTASDYRAPLYRALIELLDAPFVLGADTASSDIESAVSQAGGRFVKLPARRREGVWTHADGFADETSVVVFTRAFSFLRRERPSTIVVTEMGLRAAQAALYKLLHPRVRLVIWAQTLGTFGKRPIAAAAAVAARTGSVGNCVDRERSVGRALLRGAGGIGRQDCRDPASLGDPVAPPRLSSRLGGAVTDRRPCCTLASWCPARALTFSSGPQRGRTSVASAGNRQRAATRRTQRPERRAWDVHRLRRLDRRRQRTCAANTCAPTILCCRHSRTSGDSSSSKR